MHKTEDSESEVVVSKLAVLYQHHTMSTPNNRRRRLGQADRTDNASRSAIKQYEIYGQIKGKTMFDNMRFVKIEGDNLEKRCSAILRGTLLLQFLAFFTKIYSP